MPSQEGDDGPDSGEVAAIFGAFDLDGDGRLEPIFATSMIDTGQEVGAVLTWGKARAEYRGSLLAAKWQPDPHHFVVNLLPQFEEQRLRCIAAGKSGFVECAAAERVRRWDRAHDTAPGDGPAARLVRSGRGREHARRPRREPDGGRAASRWRAPVRSSPRTHAVP